MLPFRWFVNNAWPHVLQLIYNSLIIEIEKD